MTSDLPRTGYLVRRVVVLSFAWVSSAVAQGSGVSALGITSVRPAYNLLDRSEEDWSSLRATAERMDKWDGLKFIAVTRDRSRYLTLGGEARSFYEFYRNYNWGNGVQDNNGFFLHRLIGSADAHVSPHARIFAEMKSGLVSGRTGGPRPGRDEDRLDVGQLFIQLRAARGKRHSFSMKVGRQQLQYGEGNVLDVRDLNVRRSFDGAKLIVQAPAWRADVFAVRPVKTEPGLFDDVSDRSQMLWGAYATRATHNRRIVRQLDVYYLMLLRKQALFVQGAGRDRRHTLGALVHGQLGDVAFFIEGDVQTGTFGGGRLRAWKYAQSISYTMATARLRPTVTLLGAISSGDKDPKDSGLQTFYPLFPKGVYYGYTDGSGSLNAIIAHPKVSVPLSRTVSFGWDTYLFFRQQTSDGLYSQPGGLLRTGGESARRYVGMLNDVTLTWLIDRHATVQFISAYYNVGAFLRETNPPGKNITYFGMRANYIF